MKKSLKRKLDAEEVKNTESLKSEHSSKDLTTKKVEAALSKLELKLACQHVFDSDLENTEKLDLIKRIYRICEENVNYPPHQELFADLSLGLNYTTKIIWAFDLDEDDIFDHSILLNLLLIQNNYDRAAQYCRSIAENPFDGSYDPFLLLIWAKSAAAIAKEHLARGQKTVLKIALIKLNRLLKSEDIFEL